MLLTDWFNWWHYTEWQQNLSQTNDCQVLQHQVLLHRNELVLGFWRSMLTIVIWNRNCPVLDGWWRVTLWTHWYYTVWAIKMTSNRVTIYYAESLVIPSCWRMSVYPGTTYETNTVLIRKLRRCKIPFLSKIELNWISNHWTIDMRRLGTHVTSLLNRQPWRIWITTYMHCAPFQKDVPYNIEYKTHQIPNL